MLFIYIQVLSSSDVQWSVLGPTGWLMVLPCTSLQRRKEVLAGKFQINHCFAGVVRGSPSDHLYTVYPSTPAEDQLQQMYTKHDNASHSRSKATQH